MAQPKTEPPPSIIWPAPSPIHWHQSCHSELNMKVDQNTRILFSLWCWSMLIERGLERGYAYVYALGLGGMEEGG